MCYDASSHTYTVAILRVEAGSGVTVTVHHNVNLVYDNCDCREIVVDRLTRAQNSLAEKEQLLQVFDKNYELLKKSGICKRCDCGVATNAALGGLIWELLSQLF